MLGRGINVWIGWPYTSIACRPWVLTHESLEFENLIYCFMLGYLLKICSSSIHMKLNLNLMLVYHAKLDSEVFALNCNPGYSFEIGCRDI